MTTGQTVRLTHFTDVQPDIQMGWKAGGRKPRRMVYVALILGTELHPDDVPEDADIDALYDDGTLLDPNKALEMMGWKRDGN